MPKPTPTTACGEKTGAADGNSGWGKRTGARIPRWMIRRGEPWTCRTIGASRCRFAKNSPSGTGGGFLDGGVGWYRKTFTAPAAWRGKRVFIQFDGAYMDSRVWINGILLGARPYGYISFEYDLTPHLKLGETNTVAVRLENKQPTSRWYSGSGIYRNVWLTVLDPLHVDGCGLFVSTAQVERAAAVAKVNVRVRNQAAAACPASLQLELFDPAGKRIVSQASDPREIAAGQTADFEMAMPVADPRLWSLEEPNLYSLQAKIRLRRPHGGCVPDGVRNPHLRNGSGRGRLAERPAAEAERSLPAPRSGRARRGGQRARDPAPAGDHEGHGLQRRAHLAQSARTGAPRPVRPDGNACDRRGVRRLGGMQQGGQRLPPLLRGVGGTRYPRHGPPRPQPPVHRHVQHRQRDPRRDDRSGAWS